MGREYMGVLRSTFVIDKQSNIVYGDDVEAKLIIKMCDWIKQKPKLIIKH